MQYIVHSYRKRYWFYHMVTCVDIYMPSFIYVQMLHRWQLSTLYIMNIDRTVNAQYYEGLVNFPFNYLIDIPAPPWFLDIRDRLFDMDDNTIIINHVEMG